LTNNNILELGDLEALKELKHLKYISLLGNPVQEKRWYREWLSWRIPGLRVLDFQRIRDKVRSPAPFASHATQPFFLGDHSIRNVLRQKRYS
jgi:U2 small nuclear ribonucleoprotein A'